MLGERGALPQASLRPAEGTFVPLLVQILGLALSGKKEELALGLV